METVVFDNPRLVKTCIRLRELRLADGVTSKIVISKSGEDLTIKFLMMASEDIGLAYEVTEPPSQEALDQLYLESVRLAEAAKDEWKAKTFKRRHPPILDIGGIEIDIKGLGFDQ